MATMNAYICELIGDGTEDNPFRTCMAEHIKPATYSRYNDIDGRSVFTSANGVMLTVVYNLTPEESLKIKADNRIVEITDKNLDILTTHGVPQPKDTKLKTITNTIAKRFLIRQKLKDKDFTDLSANTLSTLNTEISKMKDVF